MSFLAQLRQQPDTPTGLKLGYFLHIETLTQRASLNLRLIAQHNGQPDGSGNAYFIQQQHLNRPPPFLGTGDITLLQTLINTSPDWLGQHQGELPLSNSEQFLQELVQSQRCFVVSQYGAFLPATYASEHSVQLRWVIDNIGTQQLRWQSPLTNNVFCIGNSIFTACKGTLTCTINKGVTTLGPKAIKAAMKQTQAIKPESVSLFLTRHQTTWKQWGLPCPGELSRKDVVAHITPVLHCRPLSTAPDKEIIQLTFRYASAEYCMAITTDICDEDMCYLDGDTLIYLKRQPEYEQLFHQKLLSCLSGLFTIEDNDKHSRWQPSSQHAWQTLLIQKRPALEAMGFEFLIDTHFSHHYILADGWHVHVGNNNDQSCQLSVQLRVADSNINLNFLLDQLREFNRELHSDEQARLELPDGRLVLLSASELNGIIKSLDNWLDYSTGNIHVPDSQLYRLHELHQTLPSNTLWQGDVERLDEAIRLHQAPALLDQVLRGVDAQLRPYQWLGVCWLQHLKQHNANGLLADDMGLGKTLQTLSHLSLEQQQGALRQPALIIAPTSLLHNWADQIQQFTPHLRHCVIHGPQRHQHWKQINTYDVVISSYTLISNDLSHWQQQPLSWIVLDEAQVIKNSRTRISQAVRQLNSQYRLCLSGTPVENHLGELWSILDFLMPNCLGSYTEFKNTYRKPIEQEGNKDRLQQLLHRIAPFMLRRDKNQVAQDLPAKTEIHQTISLDQDQWDFYQHIQSAEWRELQQQLPDKQNSGQQQILLLTALLKLRQACCDPRLLDNHTVSSAKREVCLEMIQELVAEKRAILVFSQFTAMLDLIAQDLQACNIDYLMLTGSTRNRQQVVDAFQQGKAPVFLISLKAGGVGLNLTQADTVIHFDPWWNSAAEQQATDRAHRIGQDKPVFVYKLIAENTIEEKIAQLQQRKALLGQHVNHQAQTIGNDFALKFEDLLALWQQEPSESC